MDKVPFNKNSKKVLAFNPAKQLTAVFRSITAAGRTLNIAPTAIYYVCSGKRVSTQDMYFRWLSDDVEIDWNTCKWGDITLSKYDKLVGDNRKVYRTRKLTGPTINSIKRTHENKCNQQE